MLKVTSLLELLTDCELSKRSFIFMIISSLLRLLMAVKSLINIPYFLRLLHICTIRHGVFDVRLTRWAFDWKLYFYYRFFPVRWQIFFFFCFLDKRNGQCTRLSISIPIFPNYFNIITHLYTHIKVLNGPQNPRSEKPEQ